VSKLPCLEAHSIPYSQQKVQIITSILDGSSNVIKSAQKHFGENGHLGLNCGCKIIHLITCFAGLLY
jgi:hypothetical protein